MSIRITPLMLLLLVLPLAGLAYGLSTHPELWVGGGRSWAAVLLRGAVLGVGAWVLSHTPMFASRLALGSWAGTRRQPDNLERGALGSQLVRGGSVVLLWAVAGASWVV